MSWLRYVSPFHYLRTADIVAGLPYGPDVGVLAAFGPLCLSLGLTVFTTRDLTR
jgi:hypothetical protein